VRFSLGFGTIDEDVEQALAPIEEILAKLSKTGLASSALCTGWRKIRLSPDAEFNEKSI